MIRKLFSRNPGSAFSRRQVFRVSMVAMVIGIFFGTYVTIQAQPLIADAIEYIDGIGKQEYTAVASSTVASEVTQQEKLDTYTDEIFEERQDAYRRDARTRAIERMQSELETEKETIRAAELEDANTASLQ